MSEDEQVQLEEVSDMGTVSAGSATTNDPGLAADVYKALLIDLKAGVATFQEEERAYYLWQFLIDENLGTDEPVVVGAFSNRYPNPTAASKTVKWYQAILGRELEIGESMDKDAILNKPCRLQTEEPKRDGRDIIRTKVLAVLPPKNTTQAGVRKVSPQIRVSPTVSKPSGTQRLTRPSPKSGPNPGRPNLADEDEKPLEEMRDSDPF